MLFVGKLSMTPLLARKPQPRGLYVTIPMPSSLYIQVQQDKELKEDRRKKNWDTYNL